MNATRIPRASALAALVAALVTVAGCSSPYGWNKQAGERIDADLAAARQARKPVDVPADVNAALLPPIQAPNGDGQVAAEHRFDLALNNAPARQVFMGLVEGTPYGMVVHPDVNGTISLDIKDVTVGEAMDTIRRVYGYQYRRDGNRYLVLGRGMQTRMFPINYLNLIRKGKSDTRVASSELSRANTGNNANSGNTATGGNSSGNTYTSRPQSAIETDSQSDFWGQLEGSIKALVGSEGGRRVISNPQSGMLVVRAMPDELAVVEDFLGATQLTVNRQVVLEAKVIEVQLTDRFQTGINWAKLGSAGDTDFTLGQVGGGTSIANGTSEIGGFAGNLNPNLNANIPGTISSAFGGVFSLAIQARSFAAFVELLKAQGEVHVLSSPRVSTVNNQKAVIKVGGDEFFVTGITSTTTVVGNTAVSEPKVELTPFFSGIALDVTPQIDANDNVVLHIHPSVSEVTQRTKTLRIADRNYELPLALSSIQESDNIVRAASGQIIIIGGLMKEGASDDNASVPLLGDIPVLGNLFKHKRITRIKKELVILLKPTVVETGRGWSDMVGESQGRIDGIRGAR